jgi:hypothetical protein
VAPCYCFLPPASCGLPAACLLRPSAACLLRPDLPFRLSLQSRIIQNDDVHAPVFRAAFFSIVVLQRVGVGIAGNGEPVFVHAKASDCLEQRDAARRRQFPVAPEARIVDWNCIGVAFHSRRIWDFLHGLRDLFDAGISFPRNFILAGGKQRRLREADRQPARNHADFELAGLDFLRQLLGQNVERGRQLHRYRLRFCFGNLR